MIKRNKIINCGIISLVLLLSSSFVSTMIAYGKSNLILDASGNIKENSIATIEKITPGDI